MNIYRIIQETINNALKYTEATKIHIDIKRLDEVLEFSIKDNIENIYKKLQGYNKL